MALPTGVTTATVTLGKAGDFTGEEGVLKVTVTPNFGGSAKRIIWEASGWSMEAWSRDVPTSQGDGSATITFELPHVDQAGWIDPSGNDITDWSYSVKVTATSASATSKQKSSYTKVLAPVVGDDNIDLDLVPDGTVAVPAVVVRNYARVVKHGSDATVTRPNADVVIWAGTVMPDNLDPDYDLWVGPEGA